MVKVKVLVVIIVDQKVWDSTLLENYKEVVKIPILKVEINGDHNDQIGIKKILGIDVFLVAINQQEHHCDFFIIETELIHDEHEHYVNQQRSLKQNVN